jgi:molybdopterin molybdotransferase
MAQLRNDCFAFGGEMMPVEDAWAMLAEKVEPLTGEETVALDDALGRVLAADVAAPRNVPPHDNSAVDGYAVYHADVADQGETRLPVTGRVAAGHPLGRAMKRGEAVRIFTGAPIPDGEDGGPDTVYMDEDARAETAADGTEAVVLPAGLKKGANYRKAGEDVQAGATILHAGTRLRAQELGLAASVGLDRVVVRTKLRAAVFSTGDEVREPGAAADDGCIYDSNRFTVKALLRGLGCAVTDLGILPDDEAAIRSALADAAAGHDLVITSGGVSLGEEDHVKAAVAALGRIDFWRIAVKPGRPIALGCLSAGEATTPFVGLPGNPVATMVTFMMIARPLILRLIGRTDVDPPRYPVRAAFTTTKKKGRREWLRARLVDGAAVTYRATGAGILTSMVESEGLVELPEDCEGVETGDLVDYLPFNEVY